MKHPDGLSTAALVCVTIGFIVVAVAGYMNAAGELGDANIGAGVMFLLGLVVGVVGVGLGVASLIAKAVRGRQALDS